MKKLITLVLFAAIAINGFAQNESCTKTVNDDKGTETWSSNPNFFLKEGAGAAHTNISFIINKTVKEDSTIKVNMSVIWVYPGAAGKKISTKNPLIITFKDGTSMELFPTSEAISQWNSKAKKPIFGVTYDTDDKMILKIKNIGIEKVKIHNRESFKECTIKTKQQEKYLPALDCILSKGTKVKH